MNQDYIISTVRDSLVLTGSYVAGTVVGPSDVQTILENQAVLYVSFTKGSLTTAEIKVEFSDDGITYYQETNGEFLSAAAQTNTIFEHSLAATGNYRIPIQIKDRYIKISAKGTGTVTGSLMAIKLIIGVA